jgi:hypothetical protein
MRNGDAYYARAAQSDGGERGFPIPKKAVKEFGAISAATATGVCVAATATTGAAVTLSATGSLVSGGVATFDVPRNVIITATANTISISNLVTGTDQYGATQTETITVTGTTAVEGVKAFKTVTSVVATATAAVTGTIAVGTANVIAFPYRLGDKGKFLGMRVDGVDSNPTLVAGFTTTGVSTSTTADVTGTFTATASDGSKLYTVQMMVNPSTKTTLYGVTPA